MLIPKKWRRALGIGLLAVCGFGVGALRAGEADSPAGLLLVVGLIFGLALAGLAPARRTLAKVEDRRKKQKLPKRKGKGNGKA